MKNTILLLFAALAFSSCEKALFGPDKASGNPFDNFDYLWGEIDAKYSYFQLKDIDWDLIREEYRAQISEDMSEDALFEVLGAMMNELKDDHSNLVSPFNISRYNVALRNKKNYYQRTLEEFYLPNARITGAFVHDFLADGQVAYWRYSSFMNPVDDTALDYLIQHYSQTKGLILDLRENGGGAVVNIPMILQRFAPERRLAAYSITRNGPGRNDFSERREFYINETKFEKYTQPVLVLIDRGSYSATTFFALLTKAFDNITLVGDTTGGGGGLPNGGQLPNGWFYRFSVSQILDLQGNNFAEQGVPADIPASFDESDLTKDEILELALDRLLR
jgi:C-terminal processing protease CtpA/Prc